jgi:hypothetical protein
MWRFLSVVVAGLALMGTAFYSLATPGGREAMYGLVAPAPQPSAPVLMKASVHGTVTLDGHPLMCGMVQVVAEDGQPFMAPIHKGKFFLPLAPEGRVHVGVQAPPVLPCLLEGGPMQLLRFPKKYLDPHTSGLTGNLVEGVQSVSLDLRTETDGE